MLLSLTFKENTISNFLLYMHKRNTNKGSNSYKLKNSKIGKLEHTHFSAFSIYIHLDLQTVVL